MGMKMSEMSILNRDGDTKHKWDKRNPESVSAAQAVFASYTKQGFRAARMQNGTQGEFINEFDPEAEFILFVPVICGG